MDITINQGSTQLQRHWKALSVLGVAVLVGAAAVPAMAAIRDHQSAVTSTPVASSSPLTLSIPASSSITTAPNVIGLENFAARAVRLHKVQIVVSGNFSSAASAGAVTPSRQDVAVNILRSALTALHSNIVVVVATSNTHATALTVSS